MLQGLQDPQFMATKEAAEKQLLDAIAQDAETARPCRGLEDHRASAEAAGRTDQAKASAINANLFQTAQTLVRMAVGRQEAQRSAAREYRDSARESLLQQLFSPAPVYKDLEQTILADMLGFLVEQRGGDDPLIQQVLAGRARGHGPRNWSRARDSTTSSSAASWPPTAARPLESCDDPMIQLAKLVDPESRRLREEQEAIEEEERQAYAQIAEAVFATQGTSTYPDATFTLRLAFGVVKGYEQDGEQIPPWTTIGGVFDYEQLHGAKAPVGTAQELA